MKEKKSIVYCVCCGKKRSISPQDIKDGIKEQKKLIKYHQSILKLLEKEIKTKEGR